MGLRSGSTLYFVLPSAPASLFHAPSRTLVRVIAPWPDLRSERNSIMKLMMSLFGLIVLLGSSGCVIHERGGVYDDGYYRGDGYGYRYDHDHDRWGHDNYYRTYRY